MCALDFDGRLDFWAQHHPTAKKPHQCIVCRAPIAPGERYLRESGKWEGELFSEACCLACELDRDSFGEAHGRQFPFVSSFIEYLEGCITDGDQESDEKWRPMLTRIEARGRVAA